MNNIHYASRFKSLKEIPNKHGSIIRYNIFKPYCKNKVVVDIGCGGGQGTYIISTIAKKVLGLDFINDNIDWCNKYWSNNNIEYVLFDANTDKLKNNFDVIIISECIEHLEKNIEYTIINMCNNLNETGVLCLTFPEDEKNNIYDPTHKQHNIKRKDICVFLEDNNFNVIEEFLYDNNGSIIIAKKER